MLLTWQDLVVEQTGNSEGICGCCGHTTKRSWGFISEPSGYPLAAYFLGWTDKQPSHGASFDLILGKWGEGSSLSERYAVAVDYYVHDRSPSFMVVDAADRLSDFASMAGKLLKRSEVIEDEISKEVFVLLDAAYMKDPWIKDIHTWL